MTFTITLISRHGIWQSSDLRLTDPRTRRVVDDYSVKHVAFRCRDGAGLLTYAGVGSVDGVQFSDWIRQFMRGRPGTVDETLIEIRQRATEDLGGLLLRHRLKHMFTAGVFIRGVPWGVQIRNFSVTREFREGPVEREFQTVAVKVPDGTGIVVPWPWIISEPDLSLLQRVSSKHPRRPKEFSDLLGDINLRTAESPHSGGLVSRHCVTSYLPPHGDGVETEMYHAPVGAPPIITPFLLFGIDVTEMAQEFNASTPEASPAEIVQRAMNKILSGEALTSKDLLRPAKSTAPERSNRMIGLVYYEDDPEHKIFRKVYPEYHRGDTESVLDDPQWITTGCDPDRKAVLIKVPADSPQARASMTGKP